jgi:hypothetical protein
MRIFFNFSKNASALAVLLCCFFFNLGEGKAQLISNLVSAGGTNIKIIYEGEAICGQQQPAGKFVDLGDFSVNADFSKQSLLTQMEGIPKSKYYRIKKKGVGNPKLTIQVTGSQFNGSTNWNGNSFFDCYAGTKSPNNIGPSPQGQYEYWVGQDFYNFSDGIGRQYHLGDSPSSFNARCWPRADEVGYIVFFFSYFKLDNTWADKFAFVLPFVIEGTVDESVPVLGTTVQPQIPYLVLHAPPGDHSSSSFQATKTTCREFVDTYSSESSNSVNLDVKLGIAGSVGFIVTTDFEFSVTFSAGATTGALAITTKSNQTCVTASEGFSTNMLPGVNGSGDVFVGYGTDLNYGIYRRVITDTNTCKGILDTSLIYSPTGTPRKFAWTEEQIQADIINQNAIAANTSYSVRARNEAQNQADVWEKVLALNTANKNNPNNAVLQSLSFSAGANSSQESSITVLETNSLEVDHYIDFNVGVSSVVEVAGSGVSGGYEYKGSYHYGKTQNQSQEVAKVVHYDLIDNSTDGQGDLFNLTVVRDPMFGTPVFRLEQSSRTSCPYQGGYQRDQPKLKHLNTTDDHITILGAPVNLDSSAIFSIQVCNNSNEARTYLLKLLDNSNPGGARVFASGFELNVPRVYQVDANSCKTVSIEVKRLSTNSTLAYPNLELQLYPECEPDISSSVFASVYFGSATGVNDLADNSLLSVSPNPTSGWLQISLPEGNTLEAVRVMDLSGKTVRTLELGAAASKTELDLAGLPKGIYALQARTGGQVFLKKVVVE